MPETHWKWLYPAEQARTLHAGGIRSLVAELASENAAQEDAAMLEAAE